MSKLATTLTTQGIRIERFLSDVLACFVRQRAETGAVTAATERAVHDRKFEVGNIASLFSRYEELSEALYSLETESQDAIAAAGAGGGDDGAGGSSVGGQGPDSPGADPRERISETHRLLADANSLAARLKALDVDVACSQSRSHDLCDRVRCSRKR